MRKKNVSKALPQCARPWFVFIFLLSSKNELEAASSTAHSFALLKDNELLVPMAFALASPSSFVLNSMQSAHEMHY